MNLGNVRLCMYVMCLFIFEEKVEILDHFEPEPGSKCRRSYFRIKVEILGHFQYCSTLPSGTPTLLCHFS